MKHSRYLIFFALLSLILSIILPITFHLEYDYIIKLILLFFCISLHIFVSLKIQRYQFMPISIIASIIIYFGYFIIDDALIANFGNFCNILANLFNLIFNLRKSRRN